MAIMRVNSRSHWKVFFLLNILALFLLCPSLSLAAKGTKIQNVRIGVYPTHTRLVFDAEGDRPSRIGPPSEDGITIECTQLQADPAVQKRLDQPTGTVSSVNFREGGNGSQIYIAFRNQKTTVKHQFLPSDPPRAGHYRFILDFFPPGEAPEEATGPLVPNGSPSLSNQNGTLKDKRAKGKDQKQSSQVAQPPDPPVPDNDKSAGLYEQADNYFLEHQQVLVQEGPQVLEYYMNALKEAPKSPHAPLAIYRCGLAYTALGNVNKAEKYFQQLISAGPDRPMSAQAWMRLGEIFHQRKSNIEAIEAFRFALRSPLEKSEKTEAYYGLGRDLSIVGAHKEAQEALNQCLGEDPFFYIKKPDLLKYLGESSFALQQFDTSREQLIRYLNLKKDSTDHDLILAKVAEISLHQGEERLANRIYAYIQKNYQDSEGDIISRIRHAEILEKRERTGQSLALTTYQDLYKKSLPPPLKRLVCFKLASWEWRHGNYQKSLDLADEILQAKTDSTSQDEFKSLKEKVITEWVTKAFSEKNHFQIVQLFEKYGPVFRSLQSPELDSMIAESYGSLQLYSNAVEIYERLLSAAKKKSDDWLMKVAQYTFLLGDTEKAAQFCRQIQSEAFEARKSELLGRIAFQQAKHADAVKYFSKLLHKEKDLGSLQFESILAYSGSLIALAKHEEALSLLQKALDHFGREDSEKRVQICLQLSRCYQEMKQPQKAIETMETALAHASSEEQKNQLNYEISKLYLTMGQSEKASHKLSQLLGTSQSFWKTAAQQQLDSIQMGRPK